MESIEKRVQTLLSQMTLEEKLAQIGSYWMYDLQTDGVIDWDKTADKLKQGIGQITRVAGASTLDPLNVAKRPTLCKNSWWKKLAWESRPLSTKNAAQAP